MKALILIATWMLSVGLASAETNDNVKDTFDRFITAQTHDLSAARELLLDSPDFLGSHAEHLYWGREAALKRFELFDAEISDSAFELRVA